MRSTIDLKDCNLGLIKFHHYFVQHSYLNECKFFVITRTFKLFIYTFIFVLLTLPNVPLVPDTK